MSPMLAKTLERTTNIGFGTASRRGKTAWNKSIGPMVLASKWSRASPSGVSGNFVICLGYTCICDHNVEMRNTMLCFQGVDSTSGSGRGGAVNLRHNHFAICCQWRLRSVLSPAEPEGSRTAAMTTVFGRETYLVSSPSPMPDVLMINSWRVLDRQQGCTASSPGDEYCCGAQRRHIENLGQNGTCSRGENDEGGKEGDQTKIPLLEYSDRHISALALVL
jgi:hypothetical protein